MTGADLRRLRWGYAMDSAPRLAARIGCHESTIRRNEKRATVTDYVADSIEATPTAHAFYEGMQWRD